MVKIGRCGSRKSVESWRSLEEVRRLESVGLFLTSLNISYEQLQGLLTKQWIEEKYFDTKNVQKNRSVMLRDILPIDALVVVDTAQLQLWSLNNVVADSRKFVKTEEVKGENETESDQKRTSL